MVMLREVTSLAGPTCDQTIGPYTASVRLAATLGAPAAGALIAFISAPAVLAVDAATFLISATLIFLPVPAAPDGRSGADPAKHLGRSDLTAGFKVLHGDRMLLTLTCFAVVLAVMTAGWNSVGAPIHGKTILHSAVQLGMVLGFFGAGGPSSATWPTRPSAATPSSSQRSPPPGHSAGWDSPSTRRSRPCSPR
jgi:hypothetical protein